MDDSWVECSGMFEQRGVVLHNRTRDSGLHETPARQLQSSKVGEDHEFVLDSNMRGNSPSTLEHGVEDEDSSPLQVIMLKVPGPSEEMRHFELFEVHLSLVFAWTHRESANAI